MYFTVLVLVVSVLAVGGAKCPQPEFLDPCTCRPWETGVYIICYQVNNTNSLDIVFQFLRDYEITRLLLKDCHLNDTTSHGIFSGLNIKLLRLLDSSLTRAESNRRPGTISGLAPHLERLDVTHCDGLFKIGQLELGSLNKLKDLYVVRDNLTTVRRSWLPPNIINLRIEDCSIENVESDALVHMGSLASLTLKNNRLTTLRRDVLPTNCLELGSIDLSYNRIQSLEEGFFNGMNKLHSVDLCENQLQSLDQRIWGKMWTQLYKLWINRNAIRCDETVDWIFDQESKPTQLYGVCSQPERLNGTELALLSRESLQAQRN